MMNPEARYLPQDRSEVLVAANPKAGARSSSAVIEQLVSQLCDRGYSTHLHTEIDSLADAAQRLHQEDKLRAVVAAGGDGTVSLVVNRTPPGTPIAVLPLGTENLLAKYLGIQADASAVCGMIATGAYRRLDAGEANGRLFLLMAGCGFDAEVVRRLHSERTGHIHHLSYAKPIWDSILNYEYPELQIEVDVSNAGDRAVTLRAKWAFVVNLPRYARGLSLVPGADGEDGRLDLCTFKQGSLWTGLMYLGGVITGQHQSWDDCAILQAERLRITSEQPAPFQVDGDPGGFLPVEIRTLPQRLTLLVPE